MEDTSGKKRVRDESSESWLELSESKRFKDDLLELFDEADLIPSTQDLDSIMKSLQDEISASHSPAPIIVTSNSGEYQPHIGYLLEASDDELGIPPPGDSSVMEGKKEDDELFRVSSDSSGIGELWQFEDHMMRYDSFDMGNGFGYENSNTEYVLFDGLFDNSDLHYDSAEFSESWRHETMPEL
ncbi:hypothetical protein TanjilG_16897 [Lupinus angustifolius]|uniref:uncharacterized protein LOC109335032 n=1 Tax=Lupinus angustifolius TaxID=3871 RepID=UPI00090CDF08|nr:PREDICTED: uncharacterized protein LOC109335032 [Lupinus angustifolius]OIV90937.1 hypothetical protein TanjilG_16897 [Lupinus angustifolius]